MKRESLMPFVTRRAASSSLISAAAWGLAGDAKAEDAAPGIKAAIDGAYILEEWHINENVFRPPQVEGRVVFLNGAVVSILINNTNEERKFIVALFGTYKLSQSSFSYRYDNSSIFIQTASSITESHNPPFDGMRDFDITRDGATVQLESRSPERASFIFDAAGQKYSEGGKLVRVWKRSSLG
jgi:hypothetical protein